MLITDINKDTPILKYGRFENGEIQEPFMEYCENFGRKNYEIYFNPERQ